jgi:hypothetical protein
VFVVSEHEYVEPTVVVLVIEQVIAVSASFFMTVTVVVSASGELTASVTTPLMERLLTVQVLGATRKPIAGLLVIFRSLVGEL